ncbi:uncharacterized protein LOC136093440 [Hydra vulgaris]|uniref:uncharacterized protein LOC136093440 n=1 Tax=Hydra vulgaris TaxID=6087 RepID=UPI0032EA2C85
MIKHFISHLESQNLFSDHQCGFRSSRSTADLLSVITDRFYRALGKGGEVKAIALDISKAFGKVWNAGLLPLAFNFYLKFINEMKLRFKKDLDKVLHQWMGAMGNRIIILAKSKFKDEYVDAISAEIECENDDTIKKGCNT